MGELNPLSIFPQKLELTSSDRGNFKMNGSQKVIGEIIKTINDAKLDDSTGESPRSEPVLKRGQSPTFPARLQALTLRHY